MKTKFLCVRCAQCLTKHLPFPILLFYFLFFIFWPHAVGIWYKETIEITIQGIIEEDVARLMLDL